MAKTATPRHLSASSKRIWRTIAEDYDLHGEPQSIAVLTAACEARDRAEQARQAVEQDGLMVETVSGA